MTGTRTRTALTVIGTTAALLSVADLMLSGTHPLIVFALVLLAAASVITTVAVTNARPTTADDAYQRSYHAAGRQAR